MPVYKFIINNPTKTKLKNVDDDDDVGDFLYIFFFTCFPVAVFKYFVKGNNTHTSDTYPFGATSFAPLSIDRSLLKNYTQTYIGAGLILVFFMELTIKYICHIKTCMYMMVVCVCVCNKTRIQTLKLSL